MGGQLPQRRIVHVAAQRQAVILAGQAGPRAGGLVGPAVAQDVRQVILNPGQPHDAAQSRAFDAAACHRVPLRFQACTWTPPVGGLHVQVLVHGSSHDASWYSESSNTRFRRYGRAATWTGMPLASSPPALPEPPGRRVLTVRASLGTGARPKTPSRRLSG